MVKGSEPRNPAITRKIEDDVRASLKSAFPGAILSISTEIQDGGLFLLIVVEVADNQSVKDIVSMMPAAGNLIELKVPGRLDEYSWILNVHQRGKLVDSLSGGWIKEGARQ